ncbi:hypothetical protein BC828DRAFT_380530 [Blastocladiella britannica]|nr:hypothetical protein BC828DRAFT_380530 [Blastocladiella britannica]
MTTPDRLQALINARDALAQLQQESSGAVVPLPSPPRSASVTASLLDAQAAVSDLQLPSPPPPPLPRTQTSGSWADASHAYFDPDSTFASVLDAAVTGTSIKNKHNGNDSAAQSQPSPVNAGQQAEVARLHQQIAIMEAEAAERDAALDAARRDMARAEQELEVVMQQNAMQRGELHRFRAGSGEAASSRSARRTPSPQRSDRHHEQEECHKCLEYQLYVSRLEDDVLELRSRIADQANELDDLRGDRSSNTSRLLLGSSRGSGGSRGPARGAETESATAHAAADDLALQLEFERAQYASLAQVHETVRAELERVTNARAELGRAHAVVVAERDAAVQDRAVLTEQRRAVLANFELQLRDVERQAAAANANGGTDTAAAATAQLEQIRHADSVQLADLERQVDEWRRQAEEARDQGHRALELVAELEADLAGAKSDAVQWQRAHLAVTEQVEELHRIVQHEQDRVRHLEEHEQALKSLVQDTQLQLERANSQIRVLQSTVDQVLRSPTPSSGSLLGYSIAATGGLAHHPPPPGPPRVAWAPDSPASSGLAYPPSRSQLSPNVSRPFSTTSLDRYGGGAAGTIERPSSRATSIRSPSHSGAMTQYAYPTHDSSSPGLDGRSVGATSAQGWATATAERERELFGRTSTLLQQQSGSGGRATGWTWQQQLEEAKQLEGRLKSLQGQKESLQADYARIPLNSTPVTRRRKEELDGRLDHVEKEIGSVRMRLKSMNFL